VPIMFDHTSLGQKKKTLKKVEAELVTEFGVKAVSRGESAVPEKYHERVWGLTTYWGLITLKERLAKKIAEGYMEFLGSRTLYGLPETISNGKPLGATHQLWSIAFLPPVEGGLKWKS
ncbi:MAG: hypothetical protein GOV01_02780, partial [Candidatus Altiarchaeota archaeon]|nr:hypothetical protein [Candidatus Altiarchaeota archaeon]